MRVLVAPDSFKGSLTAAEVCEVITAALAGPGIEVVALPLADGGEGSLDALLRVPATHPPPPAPVARRVREQVPGPFGDPVEAERGILPDGTAVVELAQAAGLTLTGARRDPAHASTYGTGLQLRAAARAGAPRILVALGGSATVDGGCGAAAACGVRFAGPDGATFLPVGATLTHIHQIDTAQLDPHLQKSHVVGLCDVDNPLTGPDGAAAVFAPQKGADPATVAELDTGLAHLAAIIHRDLGIQVDRLPGAGAAGGMGAGLAAFLRAELLPGADVILDTAGFDALLRTSDLVITGEGRLDSQSLRGKVVSKVAQRALAAGVPVFALVGQLSDDVRISPALHLRGARAITPAGMSDAAALTHARENLARAAAGLRAELLS